MQNTANAVKARSPAFRSRFGNRKHLHAGPHDGSNGRRISDGAPLDRCRADRSVWQRMKRRVAERKGIITETVDEPTRPLEWCIFVDNHEGPCIRSRSQAWSTSQSSRLMEQAEASPFPDLLQGGPYIRAGLLGIRSRRRSSSLPWMASSSPQRSDLPNILVIFFSNARCVSDPVVIHHALDIARGQRADS